MAYLTWLATVLRDAGLTVREVPGWQQRGHGEMRDVLGVLAHHTVGPAQGDGRLGAVVVPGYPSLRVVTEGRPGLAGPLSQLGLARDGAWVVIAAGRAWHAGTGSAAWVPAGRGNDHLIGVEAESVGTRDDWTPAQRESYPRGVAAILRHLGLPASRVIGHKEWAPRRKIDPAFWEMPAFRTAVARWMKTTPKPTEATHLDAAQAKQLAEIHVQERRLYDYRNHHNRPEDDQYGHTMAIRAELHARMNGLEAKLDEVLALLAPKPTRS